MKGDTKRPSKCARVKSDHHQKDQPEDMLQFTIRPVETFVADFNDFVAYPFDRLKFKYRFQLIDFEIEDPTDHKKCMIRFDYYPTVSNDVSWKENVDALPEFDLDFLEARFEGIRETHEEESVKDTGETVTKAYPYYPGFTYSIVSVRDPIGKILRTFLPCIFLGIFLYRTFDVPDYGERLSNLSICLLTYITILTQMKTQLPSISRLTYADRFLSVYIFTSLLPCLPNDWLRHEVGGVCLGVYMASVHALWMVVSVVWVLRLWQRSYLRLR